MDDNEYTLYRKQLVENEQAKVREGNVFNEYESETLEGNKDLVFVKNLVELDFENEFQDQQINVVRNSYYTADQLAQVHDNTKRLMSDDVAIKHRSEKNRKRRAKDAKKNAKKAHELLLEHMGEQSEVDKYKTNTKLNELHLNMNMNRAKAIAKNKEDEEKLIARARRAFLVREMENTAKVIASGQLDAKEMKAASKSCYAATIEYIDILVKNGEMKADKADEIKCNSVYLSNFVHKKVLKEVCKVENARYANYFEAVEKDIRKAYPMPTEEEAMKAEYANLINDSTYAKNIKNGQVYTPSIEAYRIKQKSVYLFDEMYKKYLTDEFKEKYYIRLQKIGGEDFKASGNLNRMVGRVLKYVEFDPLGQPLEKYRENHEWNMAYLDSLTTEEVTEEKKEQKKKFVLEFIDTINKCENILDNLEDANWLANNFEYIQWFTGVCLVFVDNILKGDPSMKATFDEIMKKDEGLKKKFDKFSDGQTMSLINGILANSIYTLGYDNENRRYLSDIIRDSNAQSVNMIKMSLQATLTGMV